MTQLSKRALFWTPRALSIAFIAFVGSFALDVFGEGRDFSTTVLALVIHLIPALILSAILILAWRWEWIGAVLYAAAGVVYVVTVLQRQISPGVRLTWILAIAGPAFLLAIMFLAGWLKRGELHAR